MDKVASDLRQGLLKELECVVCFEYMRPPIPMCQNGHIICSICKPKLNNCCPSCRQPILEIRCLALENLARQVDYPCAYKKYGCKEYFRFELISQHESVCNHVPVTCPFKIINSISCFWDGSRKELKKHLMSVHGSDAYVYKGRGTIIIRDYKVNTMYLKLIYAYNEAFFRRAEVKDGIWHCTLFHVGTKDSNTRYRYSITFDRKNDTDSITYFSVSHRLGDDLTEIYKSCKCIKLPYDVVGTFIDECCNLHYDMEIFPEK